MAWIKEVSREEDELLKSIYESAEKRTGEKTANVLKVHSQDPKTLEIHMNLYERLMFEEGELSRKEREMIGVVVSKSNECSYCVTHHGQSLAHVTENIELMKKISEDYHLAELSDKELEICKYAEKLTKYPYRMEEEDIIALRSFNLSDLAIFQINQICAYFNYVNRIVFGLGVELE
ncbi:peroxidase-related enzyme [Peloplasma aerotolerans]|uniref:Peroxidase-related enzyme n=1 Tax=Peloplasma aerotolerans TaxID=3044389 RepID=A0AAW6U8J2_9MOLU|nr:peroxidase-related enzyme [Mariniplasma sp. M4Ah]MDI6453050.1 peroxidase-related enzyme [Mariniplasma sp. M4Ah]